MYNDHHMGICAEKCSSAYGISREAQDEHATESYQRAALAWEKVWKVVWVQWTDCTCSLSNRVLVSCSMDQRNQREVDEVSLGCLAVVLLLFGW